MAEKTETHTDIDLLSAVQKIMSERNKILEEFTKAYIAETGFLPSEIELVHQQMPIKDGIIENVMYFRRRV